MNGKETRPAYDLKSWLYHQCGARLYRLCARTRADCVLMADGVDAETRINTIERALAANTTTRLVKSLAERDGLTGLIPGDRVFVGEGEEAGCYAWIPPGGWVLLWSGSSPVNLAEAAGDGIGLDASGRLCVEWDKAPLSGWVGGGALRVEGGVMAVGVTDSLNLDDSGVCASAKAAKILNEKTGDAEAEAAAALELAGEGKALAASAETEAREARGDAAAAANLAEEAGTRAATALEAAEEALTEGAKTAALLAEARVRLAEAREDLAEAREGVEGLAWVAENRENIEKLADLVIPPDLSDRVAEIAADQVNLNERLFERGLQIDQIGSGLEEAEAALEATGADVNLLREEARARGERLAAVETNVGELSEAAALREARLAAAEETLTGLGAALAEKAGKEDVFLGATEEANAAAGLVPGALSSQRAKFLRGDGTWQTPPDTVYGEASQSAAGLLSATDKTKLDGIAAGATNTPAVTVQSLFPDSNASPGYFAVFNSGWVSPGYITAANAKALLAPGAATQNAAGLLSAADKKKLDGIAPGAQVNPSLAGYLPLAGGTMTGELILKSWIKTLDSFYLVSKSSTIVKNTKPAAPAINTQYAWAIRDKNEQAVAYARAYDSNSGVFRLQWYVSANNVDKALHFEIDAGGAASLILPEDPAAADNTVRAATTKWTRARIAAATGKGATTFAAGNVAAAFLADAGPACAWSAGAVTPLMREAARDAIRDMIARRIFAGFYFEVEEEFHFFTYDLYDQQNIADNALLALAGAENVAVFARDDDGLREISLEGSRAIELHRYATARKTDLMRRCLAMQNEADAITAYPEFEFWLENQNLLEAYLERYECLEQGYSRE